MFGWIEEVLETGGLLVFSVQKETCLGRDETVGLCGRMLKLV